MKKNNDLRVKILAFTVVGLMTVASLYAEHHEGKHKGEKWDSAAKVEKLTKKLDLTADQQAKIKTILDAKHAEAKESMEEMKDKREKTNEEILAVLNDEQKAKYKEMKEGHKDKMKEHRKDKSGKYKSDKSEKSEK